MRRLRSMRAHVVLALSKGPDMDSEKAGSGLLEFSELVDAMAKARSPWQPLSTEARSPLEYGYNMFAMPGFEDQVDKVLEQAHARDLRKQKRARDGWKAR